MIKKITVQQLRPGMSIHDINAGWMHHPFLGRKIKISDEKIIKKIMDCGIREVYIDTEKGLDVADAPTVEEVNREIQAEIVNTAEADEEEIGMRPTVPIEQELSRAREIQKQAKQTIQNIMDDIRFGKQLETEKIEGVVENMVESIFRNQDALISLGKIRKKDEYTYFHSMSVGVLMISFARQMGFDRRSIQEVGIGAMLHDIGKMKVPHEILNKNGKLTDEEISDIKEHAVYSKKILEETNGISETSINVAAQHHERVDGSGYPEKLQGDEISIFGQMAAIVDVYDAMTADRCYQKKFVPSDVLKRLYEWSKHHFNRDLVQRFIRCVGIYPIGTLVRLESGMLGVIIHHSERSLLEPVVRVVFNPARETLVMPYDLDLSNHGGDRIKGYESPEKWDINPVAYLK
ncbi:MAG: phosphodiesterase [Nitrospira bacterium SG8_35_4]|nr:MAG: phosphodiesterase [Nitrospira bacterium SG8_35_4]